MGEVIAVLIIVAFFGGFIYLVVRALKTTSFDMKKPADSDEPAAISEDSGTKK